MAKPLVMGSVVALVEQGRRWRGHPALIAHVETPVVGEYAACGSKSSSGEDQGLSLPRCAEGRSGRRAIEDALFRSKACQRV